MSEHDRKVHVTQDDGVARVWLKRPEVHNAFDDAVIAALEQAFCELSEDASVRAIVIGGDGKSFSAGADLQWMKRAAEYSIEENRKDALGLARMLRALAECPKATIARVHGAALGGGLGLLSACDLAFATERAKFGFSEVRLGLVPGVISPHVIRKIGPGHARALFVTGERFDAHRAHTLGLIHRVVADEAALDAVVDEALGHILASAPGAVAAAKELVAGVLERQGEHLDRFCAEAIANRRADPEGKEGIAAFFAKRPPAWGQA